VLQLSNPSVIVIKVNIGLILSCSTVDFVRVKKNIAFDASVKIASLNSSIIIVKNNITAHLGHNYENNITA